MMMIFAKKNQRNVGIVNIRKGKKRSQKRAKLRSPGASISALAGNNCLCQEENKG